MIHYRIEVRFRTDGECRYRREEAEIPKIPDWYEYCEGGRVYHEWYMKGQAKPPYKKRWLGHDLYYKAYHVEYWSIPYAVFKYEEIMPSNEYIERITNIIKPLPNEFLVERRAAKEPDGSSVFHDMYYYYKFVEIDGRIQAVLENSVEKKYIVKVNRSRTKTKRIPI